MLGDCYDMLDSDEDRDSISSSEDEVNELLGRSSTATQATDKLPEVEDDFEKEMEAELAQTMTQLEEKGGIFSCKVEEPLNKAQPKPPTFYDDIYFDSDEEEGSSQKDSICSAGKKQMSKRRVLTNDELLYDPEIDNQNQLWMDNRRRKYQPKARLSDRANKDKELPESDAVLNCPSCLTTLCMDCQRHETYSNQYRAMFVFNCVVDRSKVLKYVRKRRKWSKRKKNKKEENDVKNEEEVQTQTAGGCVSEGGLRRETDRLNMDLVVNSGGLSSSGDLYHPVMCVVCKTEVAVYDRDEVYHFHNSVASHS